MYTLRNSFLIWKVDCTMCIRYIFKHKQLVFLPFKEVESLYVMYIRPILLYHLRET